MDAKGFFLGVIAAIVLFLLWKKESQQPVYFGSGANPPAPSPSPDAGAGAGCSTCGVGSSPAQPAYQAMLAVSGGTEGLISPGTPPLNTAALGDSSFYANDGPTPDSGFVFPSPARVASPIIVRGPFVGGASPGSPTTPSNITPVRATQPTPTYTQGGFQQRINVVGIPRTAGARVYLN